MSDRPYYHAYDDRYRQVHGQDLQWFAEDPTPIVADTIRDFSISRKHRLLEIGCGEGRDAYPLLEQGFDLLATDVSAEAIRFCGQKMAPYADRFQILDCITQTLDTSFDFIYAVAVLHMLVTDGDRDAFYGFIRGHLRDDGIALICTMGNGSKEYRSDIHHAFDLSDRVHGRSGQTLRIAGTSCRMVGFDTFEAELKKNGFAILKQGIASAEPDFAQMMFAIVRKRRNPQ